MIVEKEGGLEPNETWVSSYIFPIWSTTGLNQPSSETSSLKNSCKSGNVSVSICHSLVRVT